MAANRETDDLSPTVLAGPQDLTPDLFPSLSNISAAFLYKFLPIPKVKTKPEYVYVPVVKGPDFHSKMAVVAEWNMAWEAGTLRHDMFRNFAESRPEYGYQWLGQLPEHDLRLIPLVGRSRYLGYSPLYHLLPKKTLDRFGLPLLKRGLWPVGWPMIDYDKILPTDAELRLSQAVQYQFWPFLCPGSAPSAFSRNDPIRMLAHHLDFWLPYVDLVAQDRMRRYGRVKIEDRKQAALLKRLRKEAPREVVQVADREGRLRAILDAVRSNRVEEDFSPRWSFAKEDFERKIYRKRSKIKVTFVELPETIPVHGPDVEVDEHLLWQAFLGLLNQKERRITVCLRSGITKVKEIASLLGYANHSPISKALQHIRKKANELLDT